MRVSYQIFIFLSIIIFDFVLCDELVQVNMLMRHGIRSPLICYPNDPYLDFWKQWPWGELTPLGMKGMFQLGVKLRRRYIETLNFVGPNYFKNDIHIRSIDETRCMQSIASSMAAFYANSKNTYPSDADGWPGNWTPVPIHTVPELEDQVLEAEENCPRLDELIAERVLNPKFIEWEESNKKFYNEILNNTGIPDDDKTTLRLFGFFDCIREEKHGYNLTLPGWLNDSTYYQCIRISDVAEDYIAGGENFGLAQSREQTRLRSGSLLKHMIENMQKAIDGKETAKIYAFSAHDFTVASFLRLFDCKRQLLGYSTPDFAATAVLELWKTANGDYTIQAYYHPDAFQGAINFSQMITGCPPTESCPFETFVKRSQSYLPNDLLMECLPKL